MSKKSKLLFALLGACTGGGFFLGDKLYAKTVKADTKSLPDTAAKSKLRALNAKRLDVRVSAIDRIRLHAVYLEPSAKGQNAPHGNDTVILLHDVKGSAENCALYAAHYLEQGKRVLIPDARGSGESDGTYVGYGYDDRLDVLTWIHWVLKRDKQAKIVLHGLGCGAAAALFAIAEHVPGALYAVVSDSSYATLTELMTRYLKYALPSRLPVRLRLFALRLAVRVRAGYDIADASVLEAVKRAGVPVIFLHGDADTQLPSETAKALYANAQCARQLSVVLGAGHIKSAEVAAAHYWEQVDSFLSKYHPDRI